MFSSRNKKNIDTFWLKKAPYQELCIVFSMNNVTSVQMVRNRIFLQESLKQCKCKEVKNLSAFGRLRKAGISKCL